ncbi:MAG TPA: SAM-dependent methyltransferase, partial [Anaerolineae bacterium]|nr:SAM-dependent methyltransferase [Anaerolineae bacterium]
MPEESIIDTSRPNAGRIYDYLLGGSHNFEVDRQAAEQLRSLLPFSEKFVRLQRWALQDLAVELTERRGFDVIIDFASGLPTNDHLHYKVPSNTTVIYSDYDPVVVEYAHDILKDTPNVYFLHADARQPEDLLNRSEVTQILKGRRDVALITWGVSTFLTDEDLAHIAQAFYHWAGAHSCWAYNAQAVDG